MPATLRLDAAHPDERHLERAARSIQQGGIIVYPTDTLYGIGGNALDDSVVRRIQRLKLRRDDKPILLIVRSEQEVLRVARDIPECARRLMEMFWPGPLTLVLDAVEELPPAVTAGSGTVGVRVPDNRICLKLLELCGCPLTSTSANVTGKGTPRTIEAIRAGLGPDIDLFLDAGELPESKPSTVVDVTGGGPKLLREGAIPFQRILEVMS
jgi:L-threonylcarbamoyladenylate synthase